MTFAPSHITSAMPKPSSHFTLRGPPNPLWQPGQGATNVVHDRNKEEWHMIDTDSTAIDPKILYRVMNSGVSPRPIALVGTYNDDETPNLAPMSWYNIVSHDPPLVMISFGGQRERIKDGERNILQRKVFTISSASEDYAEALNFAAINAPPGISEFALCGLTPVPGKQVLAPLVEEAPFSMELSLEFTKQWDNSLGDHTTTLIIGRVKVVHIRKAVLKSDHALDLNLTRPVARMYGTLYSTTNSGFELPLPRWDLAKDSTHTHEALNEGLRSPRRCTEAECILDEFPPGI